MAWGTGECFDWPWAKDQDGYGLIHVDGKMRRLSHVVLEMDGRARPQKPADHALHSCDRPSCGNPAHLRWGTNAENMAEMAARGRSLRNENNPRAIITLEIARKIRARYTAGGISQMALAAQYGIRQPTLSQITRGLIWRDE